MKKFIFLFLFAGFWADITFTQVSTPANPKLRETETATQITGGVTKLPTDQVFKKPGHYTTEQWQELVDTFWGQGVATATKLKLFDDFWNKVHQSYGGFPNLDVNWDSLRTVYRPIVEAGVSRGRFAGILSSLTRALQDVHVGMMDLGIDSTLSYFYAYSDVGEYPNFPSFYYRPGIPIINIVSNFRTNFGAGLTPLPDNTILVYSVMPSHPLGLQPGDIILGYDGIPWKEEFNDLLSAELPIFSGLLGTSLGTTTDAAKGGAMVCVGLNWGLFDTIDVVKYSTNDTLHYPTSLLAAITPPYFIATEQLPVKGVRFPDIQEGKTVSWGIVEGTNIGYIYAWDWWESSTILFGQAVDELMHFQKVSGLILDFRKNAGGMGSPNEGFKHLFNSCPAYTLSGALRKKGDDHYAFSIYPGVAMNLEFIPTSEIFDHPIAVLLGPACGSTGDYTAFLLRFHPMVRFFGKPTNGAYRYGTFDFVNSSTYPYGQHIDDGCGYTNVNNEGYMIHKSFPVDEEVWLTRDGVAKGEDDVVNSALEWINNLAYGHSVIPEKGAYTAASDTATINAIIENPLSQDISARLIFESLDGTVVDSAEMTKVNETEGNEWQGKWRTPGPEDNTYWISAKVTNNTEGTYFTNKYATRFTTVPLLIDSIASNALTDYRFTFKPYFKNAGTTQTITKIKVNLTSNDPWIKSIIPAQKDCSDLIPGKIKGLTSPYTLTYDSAASPSPLHFNLSFTISSDGWPYWVIDTTVTIATTGIEPEKSIPLAFSLGQNYPNPFNSVTTINWQTPIPGKATLKVFDICGREVATLFDGYKRTGKYESRFNAESLPEGFYFYQLRAGEFTAVRKMLLLK